MYAYTLVLGIRTLDGMVPYAVYFVLGAYPLEKMERISIWLISKDGFVLLTHLSMQHDVLLDFVRID